ncbi:uncharacterized protein LOC127667083 [Apodemus sylvaticus]|uniref:uncharacterized protein LOC127667083 n=1 Tax=Apodemus sylvaticus TaxID=10129 RepID=UPI0022440ED6|nr:uncharacterized protein LOC127667083 [Apodemus sylvaticus]
MGHGALEGCGGGEERGGAIVKPEAELSKGTRGAARCLPTPRPRSPAPLLQLRLQNCVTRDLRFPLRRDCTATPALLPVLRSSLTCAPAHGSASESRRQRQRSLLPPAQAHFVPSPPPNCLSYKSEGRLGDQDWQAHFKVPCCGVDPSQLESEEAEVDVRERDTQRDREPKRARDLTLRDSCTDNSMQFGTRTTAAEPGFMGTWQNADTNLLFRMSQQVRLVGIDISLAENMKISVPLLTTWMFQILREMIIKYTLLELTFSLAENMKIFVPLLTTRMLQILREMSIKSLKEMGSHSGSPSSMLP